MEYAHLSRYAIAGETMSRSQALAVLAASDKDSLALIEPRLAGAQPFPRQRMQVQVLSNAKSGICPEDCHYCSQSCISQADIAHYPLKARDVLLAEAGEAVRLKACRFCMGLTAAPLRTARWMPCAA